MTVDSSDSCDGEQAGWEWAIVEVFGHRRHVGRCREEERFGAKMLRVDIPKKGDPAANGYETVYYGGSSIFSYALTDEESALRANKPYEPPSRIRLSAPADCDADADDVDAYDDDDGDLS